MQVVGRDRGGDEKGHDGLMDVNRERLGEEVCEIVGALTPLDDELALTDAVTDPVEAHVDGFGTVELDSVVGYADRTGVVTENDSGRLGIAECSSDSAKPRACAGEGVEAGVFALGDRSDDHIKDAAMDVHSAVNVSGRGGVAKVGDTTGYTTRTRTGEMGSVRLHVENHVTACEHQLVVWVGGCIGE